MITWKVVLGIIFTVILFYICSFLYGGTFVKSWRYVELKSTENIKLELTGEMSFPVDFKVDSASEIPCLYKFKTEQHEGFIHMNLITATYPNPSYKIIVNDWVEEVPSHKLSCSLVDFSELENYKNVNYDVALNTQFNMAVEKNSDLIAIRLYDKQAKSKDYYIPITVKQYGWSWKFIPSYP